MDDLSNFNFLSHDFGMFSQVNLIEQSNVF